MPRGSSRLALLQAAKNGAGGGGCSFKGHLFVLWESGDKALQKSTNLLQVPALMCNEMKAAHANNLFADDLIVTNCANRPAAIIRCFHSGLLLQRLRGQMLRYGGP